MPAKSSTVNLHNIILLSFLIFILVIASLSYVWWKTERDAKLDFEERKYCAENPTVTVPINCSEINLRFPPIRTRQAE